MKLWLPQIGCLLSPPSLSVSGGQDGRPEVRAAEDIPAFMRRVWGVLLGAVLPLWKDVDLLAAHPKMVQVRCGAVHAMPAVPVDGRVLHLQPPLTPACLHGCLLASC